MLINHLKALLQNSIYADVFINVLLSAVIKKTEIVSTVIVSTEIVSTVIASTGIVSAEIVSTGIVSTGLLHAISDILIGFVIY